MVNGITFQIAGARAHRAAVLAAFLVLVLLCPPPIWGEANAPAEGPPEPQTDAPNDSMIEQAGDEEIGNVAAETETTDDTLAPSIHVSGSVWRSKPGIVFLQTPIGLLSLSS